MSLIVFVALRKARTAGRLLRSDDATSTRSLFTESTTDHASKKTGVKVSDEVERSPRRWAKEIEWAPLPKPRVRKIGHLYRVPNAVDEKSFAWITQVRQPVKW
jgi:hypothetical protein